MRLRDQTESELVAVALLRARLRRTLAGDERADRIADAPYIEDWSTVNLGGGKRGLRGLCWGHPVLGDVIMTTSAVVEMGEAHAVTESGRFYVVGREDREHRRKRALKGDRGPLRIVPADPEPAFKP